MDASLVDFLAQMLLLAGATMLAASLWTLGRIVGHVKPGTGRATWYWLGALDLAFLGCYVAYALLTHGAHLRVQDLLVPMVFCLGGAFVWLVFRVSLDTLRDVRRLSTLEQESITDHLTGVYNRRYLQRRLEEEFARARRHKLALSLLMIDIDHFKHANDALGHAAGDVALGHVGRLTAATVRASDIVARYGGEELLVIATSTQPAQALVLAERLRRRIEGDALVIERSTHQRHELKLTVSIGVAALTDEVADAAALVATADRALYRAKAEGRNRVVIDRAAPPMTALRPAVERRVIGSAAA
jgi:diguanylate cyclase (GGDEF)-like protein